MNQKMRKEKLILATTALSILLLASAAPVQASNLTVTITSDHLHLQYNMQLDLYININGTGPFKPRNVTLIRNSTTTSDFTQFTSALNSSLNSTNPHSTVRNLYVAINLLSPNQYTMNLTVTVILDLFGVVNRTATGESVNAAARGLSIAQSMNVTLGSEQIPVNNVGELGNLSQHIQQSSSTPGGTTVVVNGRGGATTGEARNAVDQGRTFNFGALGANLASWNRVFSLVNNSTYFSLDTGHSLSVDITNRTSNGPFIHIQVIQDPSGTITSPGYATGTGNIITIYSTVPNTIFPEGLTTILVLLASLPIIARSRKPQSHISAS
jgi:hypothetical protein